MTCNQNTSIDPLQNIIDSTTGQINTLEIQSNDIKGVVDSFRSQGTGFDVGSISPSNTVNIALESLNAEALCATSTDIAPINDLTEDCLNTAFAGIKKYANNILENIENGLDAISELITLPEGGLMKLLQKIERLTENIKDLISGIDKKLQCVSLSQQASEYASQIAALNSRVDQVTGDLYLDDDGSFNSDNLMTGFNANLKSNLDAYRSKAGTVQSEIEQTIASVTGTTTKNPKRFY